VAFDRTGVPVSALALGAVNFGMGSGDGIEESDAFAILDANADIIDATDAAFGCQSIRFLSRLTSVGRWERPGGP
jgi:hypothetical protein